MDEKELEKLHNLAMDNSELALLSLQNGDIEKFHQLSASAFIYEKRAAMELIDKKIEPSRSVLFKSAAYIALDNADFVEAWKLYEYALDGNPPMEIGEELRELAIEIERVKTLNEEFIQMLMVKMRSKKIVTKEVIEEEIKRILQLYVESEINLASAKKYIERQYSIESEKHTTLVDQDSYKSWIYERKGAVKKAFWERYVKFLQEKEKWAPDTLGKLDDVTDDILDHLKDPITKGIWDKRGMVVGQVQSGKTSNYIGLMCKAADYGYKIIIVLAGTTNDLRSQTQLRTDIGFLGVDTKIERAEIRDSQKFGVSEFDITPKAHYLTTSGTDGDFKSQQTRMAGTNIGMEGNVVLIVKKNPTVLKQIIRWFASKGEVLPNENRIIKNTPLLLIDDEADNASINISRDSVSTINGLIRSLLCLFQQSAFIGYTATPFANVFIPLTEGDDGLSQGVNVRRNEFWKYCGKDLFPKDFIINIFPPSNYVGPKEVFGIAAEHSIDPAAVMPGLPLLIEIDDYRASYPDKHKAKDNIEKLFLPQSLKDAVKAFILSCAIRRVRGQVKVHNSMLVHVTRFVNWQNKTAKLLDLYLKELQSQIRHRQGRIIEELRELYEEKYMQATKAVSNDERFNEPQIVVHEWGDIYAELYKAVAKIQVRAIHGDKIEKGLESPNITSLDYYEQKHVGLSIIAVGGNKLSRGLTLEGLTISYYLRASKMYDTLMQMGRWFGYRTGYLDVCRLYTSAELVKWYKFITVASEDLRAEFEMMKEQRKTPRTFGLKVRRHPDVLQITATNKMRGSGEMELSFSDKLRETWSFKRHYRTLVDNYLHTAQFIDTLGQPLGVHDQPFVWYNKGNFNSVLDFLTGYNAENKLEHSKILEYITAQTEIGYLINWTIVLVSTKKGKTDDFFTIKGEKILVGLAMRTDSKGGVGEYYEITGSRMIDPAHEIIDFDKNSEVYRRALDKTIGDWEKSERTNKGLDAPEIPSGKNIRALRKVTEGVLLIYPLDPKPKGWEESKLEVPIIGYAISFPKNDNDRKIRYRTNEVFNQEYEYDAILDEDEDVD